MLIHFEGKNIQFIAKIQTIIINRLEFDLFRIKFIYFVLFFSLNTKYAMSNHLLNVMTSFTAHPTKVAKMSLSVILNCSLAKREPEFD